MTIDPTLTPELEDRLDRCERALHLLAGLYSHEELLEDGLNGRLLVVTLAMQAILDRSGKIERLVTRATDDGEPWIPSTADLSAVIAESRRDGIVAAQLPAARAIARAMSAAESLFGEIDGIYVVDDVGEDTEVASLLSRALGIVMRAAEDALDHLAQSEAAASIRAAR